MDPPTGTAGAPDSAAAEPLPPHVSQNIADVVSLYQQESASLGAAQRSMEHFGALIARPAYFIAIFSFVALWIGLNLDARQLRLPQWDPPPFAWLQGCLTFIALVTATVVLIGQRRQTKLSEQRAHLDLQINLLTEQKVTKLIHMLEQLRGDLPVSQLPADAHTSALKEGINAAQVASVLKQTELGTDGGKPSASPEAR
jgi:uncharacterized membrane protein